LSQKKVSIVTITYNQEAIISRTIDAILSQKTNFDITLIIGEDCSTDNTLQIVLAYQKKHPDKIKVITSDTNVGIEKNYLRCYEASQTEYVAICDGDDFWIDPYKLQKQVDFFEKNKEYGLLGTMVKYYNATTKSYIKETKIDTDYKEYSFESIFIQNPLTASTVLFRGELLTQFLELYQKNKTELKGFLDYSLWMFFSSKMKVGVLKDVTTAYTLSENSISQNTDYAKAWKYRYRNYKHFKFFSSYFKNLDKKTLDKAHYNRAIWYYRLVAINQDEETANALLEVFKKNDSIRYMLLKILIKFPKWHRLATLYEKIKTVF